MKKSIKLLSLFIITLVAIFIGKETVFASDNSPATFKATTYDMNPKPLGLTQNISIKKTTDGKYVYCLDVNKNLPDNSITYTKANLITDPAISYIISTGIDDKTDSDFYATQSALWIWLYDLGEMKDTEKDYIQDIKDAIYSQKYQNDPIAIDIRNILTNAALVNNTNKLKPTFEIESDNVKFTLKNGVYTSDYVRVNTNVVDKKFGIMLYNQPTGTEVKQDEYGFIITIPEANVKVGTTKIGVVLAHGTNVYNVYKYTSSNSKYQDMLSVYPEYVSLGDSLTINLTKDPLPTTTVLISKKDITNNNEVPGATLVIRNSFGMEIDRWVSSTTPKQFNNLPVGTYTLEEIVAPTGYELSSEKVTFTVKEDGTIKPVVMYNTPKKLNKTVITISKKDITNGNEVPGATLIIRNSNGVEVQRWVSESTPKVFNNLPVGTYTLEEIIAPTGYELSSEKVTFTVKEDGAIKPVVMYNTPKKLNKTVITISKKDITNGNEVPGATLIIRNSNGVEVQRWVSESTPKVFNNLPVGTYTLEEIVAPTGYELSSEKITFVVNEDGKVETKTMYNTPVKVVENIVKISKQDVATKKELPGATLVIRDNSGQELYRWVSTNEPYIIKGIKEGTYTLEEIIAPTGYKLSSEKITFEVKNNGVVTELVMYNTPESTIIVDVPPTGTDASTIGYILGGLIVLIGSVLIYKNVKKEQ